MMGYDYDLVFRKGSSNTVADALSRRPIAALHALTVLESGLLQQIKQSWLQDPAAIHLIHKTKDKQTDPNHTKYTWQSGELRRKGRLVVGHDQALRKLLLHHFHSSSTGGHSGMEATMKRISSVVYWKGKG